MFLVLYCFPFHSFLVLNIVLFPISGVFPSLNFVPFLISRSNSPQFLAHLNKLVSPTPRWGIQTGSSSATPALAKAGEEHKYSSDKFALGI